MTYEIAVDWNDDGDFSDTGEDVTGRCLSVRSQVDIAYGRDTGRAGSPIATGTLNLELNNASGDYYPENTSSPLSGNLLADRAVRVRKTLSAVTYTLSTAYIDGFEVQPDISQQSVRLSCLDMLAKLRGVNISTDLYQGVTTGQALGYILDAVGWPAAARDIDAGATTIRWWWEENTDAFSAMERVVNSEGPPAIVYVDDSGQFVFRDRHHRITETASKTSQATFTGGSSEPVVSARTYDHGKRNVVNSVTFAVDERDPDGELSAVWSDTGSRSIADGETLPINVQPGDPFFGAVTPEAGTDYNLLSGAVTVTLSRTQGASATIFVRATGGPAVIDSLRLRAYSVRVQRTVQVSAEDSDSIDTYGRRSYPTDAPWASVHDARAIADVVLALRAQRLPIVALTVINENNTRWTQQLARRLSNRVTIVDPTVGINADFFIERIEHTLAQGGLLHRTVFICEMAPTAVDTVFTFNVAGRGFNDGTFDLGGLSDPDTVFRFDTSGQGFDQGLLAY